MLTLCARPAHAASGRAPRLPTFRRPGSPHLPPTRSHGHEEETVDRRVDSFDAGAASPRRGTVRAHELTVTNACTCFDTCQDSLLRELLPHLLGDLRRRLHQRRHLQLRVSRAQPMDDKTGAEADASAPVGHLHPSP